MTIRVELDRRLSAWLEEEAAPHAPGELHARFITDMEGTPQRPGWATTERWISMETRARLGAVPRTAVVFATVALLGLLAAGAMLAGSGGESAFANGRIAFAHFGDIYTVASDGSDRQPLVDEVGTATSPSWSPDGKRLAYWSGGAEGLRLMVVDADGSNPVVAATDVPEVIGWPAADWSPDGTQLVWTSRTPIEDSKPCEVADGDFCGGRIFVAAADGTTGAQQIGDPGLDARGAAWSPDGTAIAFGGGNAARDIRLYVMDPDGANVRRVGDLDGEVWALYRLDWSPDGKSIVGTSGVGRSWDIWRFPADGGRETNVSKMDDELQTVNQLFPAFAADGAIAWWRGGDEGLCNCLTIREGEAEPVELTEFSEPPEWSPDGQLILTRAAGRPTELVAIDREGTVVATITNAGFSDEAVSWQRVAP